uniref:Uncharacterized protein n=1 Tax=Romanomermis culicivorax TaxID=13658 RepID=A0A915II01_ROMCU
MLIGDHAAKILVQDQGVENICYQAKIIDHHQDQPFVSNRDSLLFEPTKIVNDCNGRKVSVDPTIRDSYTPTVPHAQDNVESDTDASLPLLSIHSEMSDSEQERRQVENTKRRLRKMRRALKSESKSTTQSYENRIISSNDRDEKVIIFSDKTIGFLWPADFSLAKDKEEERQKQEELKREQERQRKGKIRQIASTTKETFIQQLLDVRHKN